MNGPAGVLGRGAPGPWNDVGDGRRERYAYLFIGRGAVLPSMKRANGMGRDEPVSRRRLWVGLAVSLSGLAVFLALASQVSRTGGLTEFDRACAEQLQKRAGDYPALLAFFRELTHLGGVPAMTGLAVLGGLLLLTLRQYALALFWVAAAGGGCALNVSLKTWIGRDRPPALLRDEAVVE